MICQNEKSPQYHENTPNRDSAVTIRVNRTKWGYEKLEDFYHDLNQNIIILNIDLTKVKYMSTAAFAYLIKIKKTLMQYGIKMSILGLQEQPRALCSILKLTNVLMNRN